MGPKAVISTAHLSSTVVDIPTSRVSAPPLTFAICTVAVSLAAIRKHVSSQFALDPKSHHLTKALKKLADSGALVKVTSASYSLPETVAATVAAATEKSANKKGKQVAAKAAPVPAPSDDESDDAADDDEEEEEQFNRSVTTAGDDDAVLGVGDVAIVEGSSGTDYEVVRDGATTWHCSCKAFLFCKKENWVDGQKSCKVTCSACRARARCGRRPDA